MINFTSIQNDGFFRYQSSRPTQNRDITVFEYFRGSRFSVGIPQINAFPTPKTIDATLVSPHFIYKSTP